MMAPRKGIRRGLGRRKKSRDRLEELTERTRREARAMSRRRRAEARRAVRPEVDIGVRLKGAAYETRRRLRPLGAPVAALFSWIGPYISRALLFVIQLVAALIALILEIGQIVVGRVAGAIYGAALVLVEAARRHVTPRSTAAFVGVAAGVGLGVSQFFDYHGVEVDAPGYAGRLGAEVPVPITGTETAGSAHLWLLLPVAAVAVLLVLATFRGRPRLAGGVSLCGVIGIAIAIAIDLPQGLDAGRPGLAFTGTQAVLLEGFWAEVACSAVLILSGGLLALYSRRVRGEARRRDRSGGDIRRSPHQEGGGIPPGLQAGS